MLQSTNAWLKPLQETISEKAAAAAAALTAQNNTKSKTVSSDAVASSTKVAASTTVSSYAWSVVVGSRATAKSTSCTPSENVPVSLMAKTNEKVVSAKPMQVRCCYLNTDLFGYFTFTFFTMLLTIISYLATSLRICVLSLLLCSYFVEIIQIYEH